MPSIDLTVLRRQLKKQRRNLSRREQQHAAHQTVARIIRHPLFLRAHHIALYIPVRGELDIRALRQYAQRHQRFYLPVLSPLAHQGLAFIEWHPHTPFTHNRFGIPEPVFHASACKPAHALDLVMTPLLATDKQGNRLGMGGGYYDRTFAFKKRSITKNLRQRRPHLLGVCYPFQQQSELPAQPWDIPLDALATPGKIQVF